MHFLCRVLKETSSCAPARVSTAEDTIPRAYLPCQPRLAFTCSSSRYASLASTNSFILSLGSSGCSCKRRHMKGETQTCRHEKRMGGRACQAIWHVCIIGSGAEQLSRRLKFEEGRHNARRTEDMGEDEHMILHAVDMG